jgi:hypothetical protein
MAHARSFMPVHLLGQGVTIMNLGFMGGAGLGQWLSGRYVRAAELAGVAPPPSSGGSSSASRWSCRRPGDLSPAPRERR